MQTTYVITNAALEDLDSNQTNLQFSTLQEAVEEFECLVVDQPAKDWHIYSYESGFFAEEDRGGSEWTLHRAK